MAGLVTDEQGAAIPGAEVKALDVSTGSVLATLSNEAGRYVFAQLSPGIYSITVSKAGFTVFKIASQKVDVGTALTINAALKIGSVSTTIEVKAVAGAELQTTNAAIGSSLDARALQSLPNMGRDAATMAVLQPGTTPSGQTAGAFSDQNVFMLDGGNNSDDMAGNNTSYVTNFTGGGGAQTNASPSGIIPTSIESIEEFRVSSFNQTADFSGSIGGQVVMVTKRGTNTYHGSAYGFYYGTNVGAANSWVNNHTPANGLPYTALPSNHRTRFGGTLGGVLLPKLLGGRTYFFVNYEGSRFPNVSTFEHLVPTPLLRAGVIQIPDPVTGKYQPYNLNPTAVTVGGVSYQPAQCGSSACDPRNIGLNPVVNQIWSKFMPLPNDPIYSGGDGFNTQGYLSSIRAPLTQNSYVARIDHDLGDRHRLFATYRYTKIVNLTTNQVDIGGGLPGDTFGQPTATAARPQLPSFLVIGLSSTIKPTMTNNFTFNYTRNFWQWGGTLSTPQLPGLGGAVEIAGEVTDGLIPYNVRSQDVRQRFWDGQDKTIKDDVTWIKGNHVFQFGGSYQRNFDYHSRTDNGQGINNQIVYQVTSANTNFGNFVYPTVNSLGGPGGVSGSNQSTFNTMYAYVLGMVSQSQVVYTRSGANLTLGPLGSSAFDQSIVPSYNLYVSDTWHIKPSLTLTYGLSYMLEMPPYELNGKQVSLTDQSGNRVVAADYLKQREQAALQGQVYNPVLGFALTPNVASKPKYPYDPFYGGLSPRFSMAWNPKFSDGIMGKLMGDNKTVIRAGYGRIFGRLNGVNLLLVPLLPPGLLQAVSCPGVSKTGQCLGGNGVDPSTVFRIGVDGNTVPLPAVSQTLAQPYLPGVNGNAGASDVNWLDPKYRPERTDNLSVTVQRQINSAMSVEVGYVGRIIRNEMLARNLDSLPYMTTLGGQTFANAFGQMDLATPQTGALPAGFALTAQPFFESALGGATSAYCSGFVNCTTAVASKNTTSIRNSAVSDLWTALYKSPSWTLPRSMISAPLGAGLASQGYTYIATDATGYGNYNAMFLTYHLREYHGLSGISNFTWGRALGTGTTSQASSSNTALDVFNLANNYGQQSFDIKFIYNAGMTYTPQVFLGQHGVLGRLLGGWTISPLFTAQSGGPLTVTYNEASNGGRQSFGEVSTSSSATGSFTTNAQGVSPYTGGSSAHYNDVPVSGTVGTNNTPAVNMFADPAGVFGEFRKCILGFDGKCGGYALRGLPRWNVDAALTKSVRLWKESVGADFSFLFTNVFNHTAMGSPALSLTTPSQFGRIQSTVSTARQMEFGLKLHF